MRHEKRERERERENTRKSATKTNDKTRLKATNHSIAGPTKHKAVFMFAMFANVWHIFYRRSSLGT